MPGHDSELEAWTRMQHFRRKVRSFGVWKGPVRRAQESSLSPFYLVAGLYSHLAKCCLGN